MNLIEQLGGYEKAKNHRDYLIDFGNEFNRPNKYEVDKINNTLLEYRRQNNIFEVNDEVVLTNKPGSSNSLHRVLAVNAPTTIHVCPINQVSGSDLVVLGFMASPFYLRHPTEDEFKAGKRLEVDNGST